MLSLACGYAVVMVSLFFVKSKLKDDARRGRCFRSGVRRRLELSPSVMVGWE